jgi:CRP/FNR family transcriptional regulator, cyclic AMP receptor protein
MNTWDAIGYVASALVLTAFGMRSIIPLRVVAMCSNVVFIIYGLGFDLTPIWSLHAALLPMNAWRLVQALEVEGNLQALRQTRDVMTNRLRACLSS